MKDPFKYLDEEEQALMESVEQGEWKRTEHFEEEKNKAESAAKATFAATKRINTRMSKRDIDRLKIKALEEGIPYQALVSGLIHKYPDGRLTAP